jgi:hypothetical protein
MPLVTCLSASHRSTGTQGTGRSSHGTPSTGLLQSRTAPLRPPSRRTLPRTPKWSTRSTRPRRGGRPQQRDKVGQAVVSVAIHPTVAGGQGQAEEGLPGQPPGGGLHDQQLRQAPEGLPRGRPLQGKGPQDHVLALAHEGPVHSQVAGKLYREEEQPQASPGIKGNNGNNVRPAKPEKYLVKLEAVPCRGSEGKDQGAEDDVARLPLQPGG